MNANDDFPRDYLNSINSDTLWIDIHLHPGREALYERLNCQHFSLCLSLIEEHHNQLNEMDFTLWFGDDDDDNGGGYGNDYDDWYCQFDNLSNRWLNALCCGDDKP